MPSDDTSEIRARIASIREGRGYVLPSHAVLAATAPALMEAYEDVYRNITYEHVALTPFEKAFVWLVVVGCAESATSGHHLKDFLDAGGTRAQVHAAAALALVAIGVRSLDVVAPGWQRVMPEYSADEAYLAAVEQIVRDAAVAPGLVDIALASGHACRRDMKRVELHIRRAKAANVADDALAEALTVCILPSGNPGFVQSCTVWRKLVVDGVVPASPALRAALDMA